MRPNKAVCVCVQTALDCATKITSIRATRQRAAALIGRLDHIYGTVRRTLARAHTRTQLRCARARP